MKLTVDINCDLGEADTTASDSNDAAIMPFISSCNIACGLHAGSPEVMLQSIYLALKHGVVIGAHPSYPDREGFGRRAMSIDHADLKAILVDQIASLKCMLEVEGGQLAHVKPHGALYNAAATDLKLAMCLAESIARTDEALIYFGLANSMMQQAAEHYGLRFAHEAFMDRAYQADGTLMPRSQAGAVISDVEIILPRVLQMISKGTVCSADGQDVQMTCDTLCLHGDNPQAPAIAKKLAEFLQQNDVSIESVSG